MTLSTCPYCDQASTEGHNCPEMRNAQQCAQSMQPCRLARMIRIWAAVTNVDQAEIAHQWQTAPSSVSRFLSGQSLPDARTMARIMVWLIEPPTSKENQQ